jgi:hypothetical protein
MSYRSLIPFVAGFSSGYFAKHVVDNRPKKMVKSKDDLSNVIKNSKQVYDSASAHPERIPDALDQARKVVIQGKR